MVLGESVLSISDADLCKQFPRVVGLISKSTGLLPLDVLAGTRQVIGLSSLGFGLFDLHKASKGTLSQFTEASKRYEVGMERNRITDAKHAKEHELAMAILEESEKQLVMEHNLTLEDIRKNDKEFIDTLKSQVLDEKKILENRIKEEIPNLQSQITDLDSKMRDSEECLTAEKQKLDEKVQKKTIKSLQADCQLQSTLTQKKAVHLVKMLEMLAEQKAELCRIATASQEKKRQAFILAQGAIKRHQDLLMKCLSSVDCVSPGAEQVRGVLAECVARGSELSSDLLAKVVSSSHTANN